MSAPEPMSFLSYDHIKDDDEIRTLALFGGSELDPIRTQLFHQKLSSPSSPWIALSYPWGPPKPTFEIHCNDNAFEVSENLWCALIHLRKLLVGDDPGAFGCFWIDAICINQADTVERSKQIKHMSSIYQNSTKVCIWLGLPSQNSHLAMAALREWATVAEAHMGKTNNMRKARWRVAFEKRSQEDPGFQHKANAVAALGNRTWFTRAWCFQEIIFAAAHSTFICGTDTVSVDHLMLAAEALMAAGYSKSLFGGNANVETIVRWRSIFNDHRWAATKTWYLSHLLEETEHQIATDPRDKIYAILALLASTSPESRRFMETKCPIRYDLPVNHVYEYYARLILDQDWNLRLLTQCYRGQQGQWADSDLPSWVPDWRVRNHLEPLNRFEDTTGEPARGESRPNKEPFDVGRGLTISPRCLNAQGWSYGRIQEVHDINGFLPTLDSRGLVPGNLDWVRVLHDNLDLRKKTRKRPMNFDSVLEFMYVLSGGNLPGIWHKLSWTHSRSRFPAHFRYEWANHKWREGDGTLWNVLRRGFQVDEGWHEKPSKKTEGKSSESVASDYIISTYEKMLGAHTSLLRKAWQWDNNIDERLDIRYSGTRQEYYGDERVRAEMAAEVLRYIRDTMRQRVFILLDNGTMGIAPATSRVGDSLYELHRGYCPFVLRPVVRPAGFLGAVDAKASRPFTESLNRGGGEFTLVGDAHLQSEGKRSSLPEARLYYIGNNESDQFIRGRPEIPSDGYKKIPFALQNALRFGAHKTEDLVLM